jgi:phosphoenolpyruvate-protein phosphotransferase
MDTPNEKTMLELTGEPISSGFAIGEVFLFRQIDLNALGKTKFHVEDTLKEVERLESTIAKTLEQLTTIIGRENLTATVSEIFKVQLRMLEDGGFIQEIKTIVHSQNANIEYVLSNQIQALETKFRSIDNELMRTRFLDVQDMYYRLLRNCLEIEHVRSNPLTRVRSPVIFVAEKLLPSDIALLDHDKLLGIIIEEGSSVSHVAIIAKALGIPAIIKVAGISTLLRAHEKAIIDAVKGKVIINPSEPVIASYEKMEKNYSSAKVALGKQHGEAECATTDGVTVFLEANVGSLKETHEAFANGARGIGLLRTELFYMSCASLPSVDEEYDYYSTILSVARDRSVTIRLLDLGADKNLPYLPSYDEENPQMGIRGIRFLLRTPEVLRKHLQSILRASKLGRVKLLIPFVTTVSDVRRTLDVIGDVCKQENVARADFRLGIMVEIPSVALSLPHFWPFIDFVNIGTNDLVQYTFAASREDGNVENYRQLLHPVILTMIKSCAASAMRNKKDLSVCGEMASDPFMAPLLIGLGVRSLSMQAASIPQVRKAIVEYSSKDLTRLAKKALAAKKL